MEPFLYVYAMDRVLLLWALSAIQQCHYATVELLAANWHLRCMKWVLHAGIGIDFIHLLQQGIRNNVMKISKEHEFSAFEKIDESNVRQKVYDTHWSECKEW